MTFDSYWARGSTFKGWFADGDARLLWDSCCAMTCAIEARRRMGFAPHKPTFVEVGSFAGRSATLLMGHEATVVLVEPFYLDPNRQPGDDGTPEVDNLYVTRKRCEPLLRELAENLKDFDYLLLIEESATAAARVDSIDLVHIDGDHSEQGVGLDAELWLPKLTLGGLALFHDYGDPAFPAVSKTVDLLLADDLKWRAVARHESLIALERL